MPVGDDIAKTGRDFRCNNATKSLKHATNLSSFVRKRNILSNGAVNLKTLVKVDLSEILSKNDSTRLSEWSSQTFPAEQKTHACSDDEKSLEICNNISSFQDLSLRLTKANHTQDLITDVAPLRRGAITVIQKGSKSKLTSHGTEVFLPSINERFLRATNSRVIVEELEVFSPNLILPGAEKGTRK